MDTSPPPFPSGGADPSQNGARRALSALQRDFVVIGKTHVKAWQAWLVIGLTAGIVAGIVLVASRSGEIAPGAAAPSVSVSGDILGIVSTVDVPNRKITFMPLGVASANSGCGVVADWWLGALVGSFSVLITTQYPQLAVPANATITRAGIPITLSDLKPSTATQSGDYFTARISSGAQGGTAVAQSLNVLHAPLTAGKITALSTPPSTGSNPSVTISAVLGSQTFALHAATRVSIITQSGGIQPATLADLAVGKIVVIQYTSIQGVKTAAQVALPSGPVTAQSSVSFAILSQVVSANAQSKQLTLHPFRSNLHVPGQCVVLNPADTYILWAYFVYYLHADPFNSTLASGAPVTIAGIPASFGDIKFGDIVDVVVRYDAPSKATTYTSVDVLSRNYISGKITGTSSTNPQSVTIRTITGSTQTLLVQPSTSLFVLTSQGTLVPGSISDLKLNKNAAVSLASVGGNKIAIQVTVQQ